MNKSAPAVALVAACLFAKTLVAANPYLDAPDDKPVSAAFRGTEWSDEIGKNDIPLSGRVVTTRLAKTSWGSVFKIEFRDLKSRAQQHREILPEYFVVTDDQIVLLNEEDNDAAAKKIAAMDKAPEFAPENVYGIIKGKVERQDGPYTTTIELKGNECIYSTSHNSGHFKTVIWEKGVGLVEYAGGYGAHADGYRLKRVK